MKRIVSLFMVVCLMFALAACSSATPAEQTTKAAEAAPAAEGSGEGYTIAYLNWGQGIPILDFMERGAQMAADATGGTLIAVSDEFTADQQLKNVQNMIAKGVDGILLDCAVATLIPQVAELCEEAGVAFAVYDHYLSEEQREDIKEYSCYAGACINEYYQSAYDRATAAYDSGRTKAVIVGGAVGDIVHDLREESFTEAFETCGGDIVGVARCTDPTETPQKAEDVLSAHPEVEAVYTMTGDFVPGVLTALENLGYSNVKIYSTCVDEIAVNYIIDGTIEESSDGCILLGTMAYMMMVNHLAGNTIVDGEGYAADVELPVITISKETGKDYIDTFLDNDPMSPEMIQSFDIKTNPECTSDYFQEKIKDFSLQYFVNARK